jgi:TonB family protein
MASRKINPWAAIAIICAAWAVRSVWADAEKAAQPAAPRSGSGSDGMTETQLRASLSILDTMRQALLKLRANVPAMLPTQVLDDRGRTFADDWQAYCLNDTDQADIEAAFTALSAALDGQNLRSANNQRQALHHRLEVMGIQCKAIADYWQEVPHPRNWAPYLSMLQENGVEPHYAVNIASLERTLKLQVRHGLFIDAIGGTWAQLEVVRSHAQQRDIGDLERKAKNSDFHGLYPLTSALICSPVAARSSGKATPSLDYSQPQPKLSYPEEARRNRQYGIVRVGLIVPATGCARAGFVLGSSGFEQLDRAAVSYAMGLRLLPAEENGVSIEALAVVPVNFALRSP